MTKRTLNQGFSLTELLIALGLLGIIATFTIPKILDSGGDSQKNAVFKDVISTLDLLTHEGNLTGELTCDTLVTFFASKMNHVKHCTATPSANGCFPASSNSSRRLQADGFVLHNGAMLSSFNATLCGGANLTDNNVIIDWNGEAGPNLIGQDELNIQIHYGGANDGRIFPDEVSGDTALYESIFAN